MVDQSTLEDLPEEDERNSRSPSEQGLAEILMFALPGVVHMLMYTIHMLFVPSLERYGGEALTAEVAQDLVTGRLVYTIFAILAVGVCTVYAQAHRDKLINANFDLLRELTAITLLILLVGFVCSTIAAGTIVTLITLLVMAAVLVFFDTLLR